MTRVRALVLAGWSAVAAAAVACQGEAEGVEPAMQREVARLVDALCACPDPACAEKVGAARAAAGARWLAHLEREPLDRERRRALGRALRPHERRWRDCHRRLHPRRYTADGEPVVEAPLLPPEPP
ncbi:MAG: hypothetical protein HS111_36420 [Kofleriaceae bacterium]|nr:hypothetical protein [Kofleriaceae bacterium]MCL4225730.1 hypothetical protein [Myxococcales bacterium]